MRGCVRTEAGSGGNRGGRSDVRTWMLAISYLGAAFLTVVCGGAVGVIGWLLSGSSLVVTRSVRASARPVSLDGASDSDHRAPTLDATRERPDR